MRGPGRHVIEKKGEIRGVLPLARKHIEHTVCSLALS